MVQDCWSGLGTMERLRHCLGADRTDLIGLDEKSLVALYTHHTSTDGASSKMCGYARSLLRRTADAAIRMDSESSSPNRCAHSLTHSLRKCSAESH